MLVTSRTPSKHTTSVKDLQTSRSVKDLQTSRKFEWSFYKDAFGSHQTNQKCTLLLKHFYTQYKVHTLGRYKKFFATLIVMRMRICQKKSTTMMRNFSKHKNNSFSWTRRWGMQLLNIFNHSSKKVNTFIMITANTDTTTSKNRFYFEPSQTPTTTTLQNQIP